MMLTSNDERKMSAAKHLIATSALSGLMDSDDLVQLASGGSMDSIFTTDDQVCVFNVLLIILGRYVEQDLGEVIFGLPAEDRQVCLEALNLAYSTKEEWL